MHTYIFLKNRRFNEAQNNNSFVQEAGNPQFSTVNNNYAHENPVFKNCEKNQRISQKRNSDEVEKLRNSSQRRAAYLQNRSKSTLAMSGNIKSAGIWGRKELINQNQTNDQYLIGFQRNSNPKAHYRTSSAHADPEILALRKEIWSNQNERISRGGNDFHYSKERGRENDFHENLKAKILHAFNESESSHSEGGSPSSKQFRRKLPQIPPNQSKNAN